MSTLRIGKKTRILANFGLLTAALIWGFAFVIVKNSLDLISPTYMMAFRFTIAAVVLSIIFVKRLQKVTRRVLLEGVVLGMFLFLSYLFQTIGCQYTTAGKNAFLTTAYVVLVPFIHWLLNNRRPGKKNIAAAFLAITGIGLLSLQGDLTVNIGDVLTLICAVGFSLHMIYIDKYTENHDPIVLTILQLGFTALFSWFLAPILEGGFPENAFHSSVVAGMLYLGLLSTMLGFLLQNVGQKYTTPTAASLLLSMESVFGVLFSTLFLGEIMTLRMLVGCGLLFIAIILAETGFSFLPFLSRKEVMESV